MVDNAIVIENQKQGVARAIWDAPVNYTIEGFTTDFSVDQGETVSFKINVDTAAGTDVPYHVEIYRMGYYGGAGATLVTTLTGLTGSLQPDPITDARGVVDAGNWAISATWDTPVDATSGVYLARLVRDDTGESNQVPFIIREDALREDGTRSDIVMQTSDTTWQAYNGWAGNNGVVGGNFYGGANLNFVPPPDASPLGAERAFGVSYNRPIITRDGTSFASGPQDYLFGADYAAIYWAEKEGYDISYISGVDTDRLGAAALLGHKAFISLGHDEYWSGDQRLNVETARDAGVNLLFWGANDIYWKTRYEPSIDGTFTDYRTLITYKETWGNFSPTASAADYANLDPNENWTGTWRDTRFVDAVDAEGNLIAIGARPENSLTGQLFVGDGNVSDVPITIPDSLSGLRLWRDTSVAAGGTTELSPGIVGYEWNAAVVDENRPAGLILLSQTVVDWPNLLVDVGSRTAPGTDTHSLSLYRAESGALVFAAGTVFWSWGLSDEHDSSPYGGQMENLALKQFTVNLLADMGIQPGVADAILTSHGLVRATASTDTVHATATIDVIPDSVVARDTYLLTGTATDDDGNPLTADGQVAMVEISFDGGLTWRPATGHSSWSYEWTPTAEGAVTITVRAIDDSLNLPTGAILASDTVTVTPAPIPEFSSIFAEAPVTTAATSEGASLELGVRFTVTEAGRITELRYFRGDADAGDTDVRAGHLWSPDGTLLATATFTSAPGEAGWQTAALDAPIVVYGGETYTASYHTEDFYEATGGFFVSDLSNPSGQLTTPGVNNGVYAYNAAAVLPSSSFNGANYWVDVTYGIGVPGNAAPVLTSPTAISMNENRSFVATLAATDANNDTLIYAIVGGADAALFSIDAQSGTLFFTTAPDFENPTDAGADNVYDVIVSVTDRIADPVTASLQISVTDVDETGPNQSVNSLFNGITVAAPTASDGTPVELGVRITPTQDISATELRYYRATGDADDTDVRDGHLWDASGNLIATATFFSVPGESGWQTATLSEAITLDAGQTYTVSYRTQDNYIATNGYFATAQSDDGNNVTAPAGANGVYAYGSALTLPTGSYGSSNYWVDLGFTVIEGIPNAAPVFTSASTFGLAENTRAVGVISATDADGDAFEFSVAGGADASQFSLDRTTGELSFIFAPDFEDPTDAGGDNVYNLLVAAADGNGGRTTQAIQINVENVSGILDVSDQGTLFANGQTPAQAVTNDPSTYELGLRFTASVDGFVDELRYFRGAGDALDTDVRTLTLWSDTGTALATATVQSNPGETGWQIARLDAQVAVTADTVYVASYGTTQNYVATGGYFATGQSGPDDFIFAPGGNNGVFASGATGIFPTASYNSTNYWVDVNFIPDIPDSPIFEAGIMAQGSDALMI